jgi:hypothetical protein
MTDEKPAEKKPGRVPLRQRLKAKFNAAKESEFAEMVKDTAEDLKNSRKERVGLAAATIIPGGWIAYYAHRRHKFKKKTAGNDSAALPKRQRKQNPPRP